MTIGLLFITYTAGFLTAFTYIAAIEYAHDINGIITHTITGHE